jgi:hypothetical protein
LSHGRRISQRQYGVSVSPGIELGGKGPSANYATFTDAASIIYAFIPHA